jgi:hypothetical protein
MAIAPLEWLAMRPYARDLREICAGGHRMSDVVERVAAECVRRGKPDVGDRVRNELMVATAITVELELLRQHGKRIYRDCHPKAEDIWAKTLVQFMAEGGQVFDVAPSLIEELAHTDVDDVHISELQLPYGCIYLRMPCAVGPITPVGMTTGVEVEGLLVSVDKDHHGKMEIGIEMMPKIAGLIDPVDVVSRMPTASIPIERDATVPQAVAQLAREIEDRYMSEELIARIVKETDGTIDPEGAREQSLREQERFEQGMRELVRFLPLLSNILLFIDNCKTEDQAWPEDAPRDLVARAVANGTGARKAEQALTRLGWCRTRRCRIEGGGILEASRDIKTHWRRGHWRWQPHGPGNSLRKRIRVRPSLVNAPRGDAPESRRYGMA